MLPIPLTPADVTPAWLSSALRAGGLADATVRAVRAEPMASLTSTMHRLYVEYDRAAAALPRTLIWKQSSADAAVRAAFGHYRGSAYQREVRFYREVAPAVRTRVPRCAVAEHDPATDAHVLLLEDVGATHTPGDVAGVRPGQLARCLRELALLHVAHWAPPDPARVIDRTDGVRYFVESLETCRDFLTDVVGTATFARLAAATETFAAWARRLDRGPRTVIHADAHPGNVLYPVGDSGRAVIVDWQGWREGSPARDLGRSLVLSLTTDDRRRTERELIAGYCAVLREHGVSYAEADAFAHYRMAAANQWTWAATFSRRRAAWDEATRDAMPAFISRVAAAALDALDDPGP